MRRQGIIQIANELIRKVPLDTIKGVIPDIRGMLEEREYRKLEKLGQKHHIPIPGMWLRRQVFMNGEELLNEYGRSHTVNRNYYNLMFCTGAAKNPSDTANFGTSYLSVKDTGGTIRGDVDDMLAYDPSFDHDIRYNDSVGGGLLSNAAHIEKGIVAGTSSAAEDFEGYALTTPIVNGSAAGQMDYSQSELHSVTNATLTLKDTLIRDLNNNSGGGITAEEVGIYTGVYIGTVLYEIMITRDLTAGDVIADAAQYRISYEITLVYPS